jgi:hypothetical protein
MSEHVSENLYESKRKRAEQLLLRSFWKPKCEFIRTLLPSLAVLLSLLLAECSSPASATVGDQQPPIEFVRSIQVTPDDEFLTGSFARINYVPATNRFVVTFGTKASTEPNTSLGAGYAYKEYNLDMQETGKSGIVEWYPNSTEAGDSGSCMVNNTYYCAFVSQSNPAYGWTIVKYDASNWTRLKEMFFLLDYPIEGNLDPCVAYVNGNLDICDQYNPSGIWQEGNSSRHYLFTADLQPIGMIETNDTPNISGASIIFEDGIYYYVTANVYSGGLVLMKYDSDWNYLGMKDLIPQAHWSQGLLSDGLYFYVAYLDTSLRNPENPEIFFPVYPNVRLAVFDRDWNLVHIEIVTDFARSDNKKGGRPWVILHGDSLYVSYDVDTVNITTEEEELKWQAHVSIYKILELTQDVDLTLPLLTAGFISVAVIAVTYAIKKKR